MTKEELIAFEKKIADLWEDAKIPYPVHFSGGNEDELIKIFTEPPYIQKGDYIFSTHRSHYHYLLAGGSSEKLEKMIMEGNSMHIFDKELNFLSSSIVGGTPCIAAGVALGLKRKGSKQKVWCFVGDATEDEGHFYEAVRYVDGYNLPCTFIIEDNDRAVETPKIERYGDALPNFFLFGCVRRYKYVPAYPHVGTGKFIDFGGIKSERNSF